MPGKKNEAYESYLTWEEVKKEVTIGVLIAAACYFGNGPVAYSELLTFMDNDETVAVKLLNSGRHLKNWEDPVVWKPRCNNDPVGFFHAYCKQPFNLQ